MDANKKLSMLKTNFKEISGFKSLYINENSELDYSDGEIETLILQRLNESADISFLENHINDWPTEYHFSWVRSNILAPINFNKDQQVLELGGGTGILTNTIAAKVKKVVAVEGSLQRAKCISTRCKHHDNVEVIVSSFEKADLLNIYGENSFDIITLIGVLEYTNKYSHLEDGINAILSLCNRLLKPNGQLVIAIENKLGLKYLMGFEEDHLGRPFYGVENRYGQKDVITFSYNELIAILGKAKFTIDETYLPFPDYKLPGVIINSTNLTNSKAEVDLVTNLLSTNNFRNYSGACRPDVKENRVLQNLITNNLLAELSNSFLLITTPEKGQQVKKESQEAKTLGYYFSTSRKYNYANKIKFTRHKDQSLQFKKEKLNAVYLNDEVLRLNEYGKNYERVASGISLAILIEDAFVKKDAKRFDELILLWISGLNAEVNENKTVDFDLMPSNILVNEHDQLKIIDKDEWRLQLKFNVSQVVARYISNHQYYFSGQFTSRNLPVANYNNVLNHYGVSAIDEEGLKAVLSLTNQIAKHIFLKAYFNSNAKPTLKRTLIAAIKWLTPPLFFNLHHSYRKNGR